MPRTNVDMPLDENGMTPLHRAIINNSNNCGVFIEQGARIYKKITNGPDQGKNAIDLLCKYSAAFYELDVKQIKILFSKISKEGLENEGEDKKSIDSILSNFAPKLFRMLRGLNGEQRDNSPVVPFGFEQLNFMLSHQWYLQTCSAIVESGFRATPPL